MAKGKETRQKMINLMYLVFIAMTAMNVDRQVLRSFEDITVTLNDSSSLTNQNNQTFYENIANKAEEDGDYVTILDEANKVKKASNDAYNAIEAIKQEIMDAMEYDLPGVGSQEEEKDTPYNALQNSDQMMKILFTKKDNPSEKGLQLKATIDEFRDFMAKASVNDRDKERIEHIFETNDIGNRSWLVTKFYEQPMVAGLANLTKIQSDIRTEEGNLVRNLLSTKIMGELELKAFQPIVMVPPFVREGETVDGSIAFGAYDNTLQGSVSVGGSTVALTDGKADFKVPTSGTGQKTISGTMVYKDGNGQDISIPFSETYEVISETIAEMPSGAVISADKMNVVYRGLDNPISATVNGADGPVSMKASVGGLRANGPGKWIFKPAAGSGEVTFTASANTSTGKTVSGSSKFRIKPVPPARAQIAGKTSLQIPQQGLAGQTVRVDWPDFLFDVTGEVTSFKVKVPGQPTAVVNGSKMSGASSALSKAKKGDVVGVFDIKYNSTAGGGSASSVTIEVR